MKLRLLLILALAAPLAACGGGNTGPTTEAYRDLPADYVLSGVRHYLTEDGVRRGVLNADSAYFYTDSSRADLTKVHLLLYNQGGGQAADLTSRTGQLDQRTNAMVARGNVVLLAAGGGKRIETQELHYDPSTHKVWSTVTTTITQSGSRTTADGFSADDQLSVIQMNRPRGTAQGNTVKF